MKQFGITTLFFAAFTVLNKVFKLTTLILALLKLYDIKDYNWMVKPVWLVLCNNMQL